MPSRVRILAILAAAAGALVLATNCNADRSTRPAASAAASAALVIASTVSTTLGTDTTVDMPDDYALHASFTDAAGGPWSYTISWGDATTSSGTATDSTLGVTETHRYAGEGTDTVVFTITTASGTSASDTALITVVDHVAQVTVSPSGGTFDVGGTVQFSAAAYGTTGNLLANRSIGWKVNRPSVATIDSGALVTARSAGTVKITASSELDTTNVTIYVVGLPFGPFRLPDSLIAKPYTGLLRASTPANLLATLKIARKKHVSVVLKLAYDSKDYSNPDSTFSLDLWKQNIDAYRGIDISSYIADGTIIGHFLIDEPRDASNWGGVPVSYGDIDAAAAYSKSIWPMLPTGSGSSAGEMEAGAPFASLDFAFSQYREKKGDLATWLAGQTASARRAGLGILLSINLLDGNIDNSSYSASQLVAVGAVLAAEPYACGLTMWKYDSLYFADPEVQSALASIAKVANGRPRHHCGPD